MWTIGHVTPPLRCALEIRMSSALRIKYVTRADMTSHNGVAMRYSTFSDNSFNNIRGLRLKRLKSFGSVIMDRL